jgi:hypothetical protein
MSKSVKKYCQLSKFLEKADKGLFNVFDDLCQLGLLRPVRGQGVTLLLPSGDFRKTIINLTYSNDPEKAVPHVKSLVLRGAYKSPLDFGKGDVVNTLSQPLQVKKADKDKVELEGGLVLKKNKKFVAMSYRDNMTVYDISGKGALPINLPPVDSRPPMGDFGRGRDRDNKKGGFIFGTDIVKKLCTDLKNHFIAQATSNESYRKFMRFNHLAMGWFLKNKKPEDVKKLSYILTPDVMLNTYLIILYCKKYDCKKCLEDVHKCLFSGSEVCEEKLESIDKAAYNGRLSEFLSVVYDGNQADISGANNKVPRPDVTKSEFKSQFSSISDLVNYIVDEYKKAGYPRYAIYAHMMAIFKANKQNEIHSGDISSFNEFHSCLTRSFDDIDDFESLCKTNEDKVAWITLCGFLVTSNLFKYRPQISHGPDETNFYKTITQIDTESPGNLVPRNLAEFLYSNSQNKVGGGSEIAALALLEEMM